MQHARHLRPPRQPVRDLDPGIHLRRQPHAHRAHAAQRQPHIVRAGILPQPARRREQRLPVRVAVHRDRADQNVRVPRWIFRRRLDRHIDAVGERLEVMDAPGVVHQHLDAARRAMRMRRASDRRHVLHLERMAAGAFDKHHARVRPQQRGDAGLVDFRTIECRLDAETLQHARRRSCASGHRRDPASGSGRRRSETPAAASSPPPVRNTRWRSACRLRLRRSRPPAPSASRCRPARRSARARRAAPPARADRPRSETAPWSRAAAAD